MKRLLKNNRGMSLMEILVALSLLMIIIVGTTPIMLQAYNGLYTAGEYTQNVYNAKTEVEDQLATRSSVRNYTGFKVNFEDLGEVATVNAKRAFSSLKNSLESLFSGARVRIYISSGSIVDDNQSNHSITLQTVNLEFSKDDISVDGTALSPTGKKIGITAYLPQKNATSGTAASVYTDARKATVTIVDDTTVPAAGRIGINISSSTYPIDFTTSPIKIVVSYLDENNKPKSAHTYLTIKTPTIMFAGETNNNVHYYTSAGVQEIKDSNGNVTQRNFAVEARKMNIGYDTKTGARSNTLGAASTQAVPANTVFKSINWITEYARTTGGTNNENIEYAASCYEPEYYVLTGTNGVIYRTYSFEDQNNIKGKVTIEMSSYDYDVFGINGLLLNSLTMREQLNKDVMGIRDKYIILDDRASTVVYPAVWGGDFSHIFAWSSFNDPDQTNTSEMGYIKRQSSGTSSPISAGTWQTEAVDSDGKGLGVGQPGFYSNLASFGYYYNGWGASTKYYTMNSRKISYILTEVENSMRLGGNLNGVGSSSGGTYGYDGWNYDRIWERPLTKDLNDSWEIPDDWDEDSWWYCSEDDDTLIRSVLIEPVTDYYAPQTKVPFYICGGNGKRPDNGMAQLRLKALTTLSEDFLYNRLNVEDDSSNDTPTGVRFAYKNTTNNSKIIVTDAVYIPATTTTEAQVFYIGTVAAYGWVNQVDNVGLNDDAPDVEKVHGGEGSNTGRLSSYWIVSSEDGTSTTIYKTSTGGDNTNIDHSNLRERLMNASTRESSYFDTNTATELATPIKANSPESHKFFITQPITPAYREWLEDKFWSKDVLHKYYYYDEKVIGRVFSDVAFTLGYTSNREMLYGKIVYGYDEDAEKLTQALKFCEPYYFESHHHNEDHLPQLYMNETVDKLYDKTVDTKEFLNSAENDYYNVWFPGEMYNLTKVATKDNVTVAVGYAVAGSTYSYHNTLENASTALGGIYNDGVISGMVLGKDSAFKSLLYFKDPNFDDSSLTGTTVTNADGTTTNIPAISYVQNGNGNYDNEDESRRGSSPTKTYNDLKTWDTGYGTHVRDSVQFTCVDISVVVSGDTTYYYAYYADNKGRVYRSLVATREKGASAAEMVEYISDKSTSPGIEDVSYMEEQTFVVDGWTMKGSNYFEKINTIAAHDDLIVITGKSKSQTTWKLNILVGVIDKENPTAAPTWKLLTWGYDNFVAHDALIRDGYLYLVGENSTSPCGFILAVPLDTLRSADNNSSISGIFKDNSGDHQLKFYAIAGKE